MNQIIMYGPLTTTTIGRENETKILVPDKKTIKLLDLYCNFLEYIKFEELSRV